MEKYLINPNQRLSKINRDIYGCFSEHLGRCIYEGVYVGEDSPIPNVNGMRCDIVNALRDLSLPVLRWPGGCFADEYHWRDGIGPRTARKKMINTHWGGVVEDNSFGTHEFFELCRQIGCDVYITGNVGSGTVNEMSEWVEYMTFGGVSPMSELRKQNGHEEPWRVKYFGVGNENWGCGGNMQPEFYGNMYNRYATYVRNYDSKNRVSRIACGPNAFDYSWMEGVMKTSARHMDGISLHYYTVPYEWGKKGFATGFSTDAYFQTVSKAYRMEELIRNHTAIMNRYDPDGRIGLIVDEWGTWYDVEPGTNPGFLYQQNTMRDAIVAGITLNIFNKHSDRVKMATLAQTVNVLQAVALTDGEKSLLTPTYYVMKLFKQHMDATLLGSYITTHMYGDGKVPMPQLIESASLRDDGAIVSTVTNVSHSDGAEIACQIADFSVKSVSAEIVTAGMGEYNDFDSEEKGNIKEFTDFTLTADGFTAKLPPCCVVSFIIR